MLTLIQCAAVILFAVLVVTVVRLARGSPDEGKKTSVEPTPIVGLSPGPLLPTRAARSIRPVTGLASDPLARSHAAAWAAAPSRANFDAGLAGDTSPHGLPLSPMGEAGLGAAGGTSGQSEQDELWSLVIQLRDWAEQLRVECEAQQVEIEELRTLLADAAREVMERQASSRTTAPTQDVAAASEPRPPRANVYDLKSIRQR